MTFDEARIRIIKSIGDIYEENEATNITELLIEHITKLSRIERIFRKNETLSSSQQEFLFQAIEHLQGHEPIQYVITEAWFAGLKFYVDKNVLIPRPETEELVDWISKEIKNRNTKLKMLDIATGSGCIAIALKNKIPDAEVWGCDKSDEALTVARMNADALHAAIDFVSLDFLDVEQRKQLPQTDIIVSNPPYVTQQEKVAMRKNVVDHEPSIALFVPDNDPLVFYRSIAEFGKEKLNKGGSIYVEINESFGNEVKELFQSKSYRSIEIKNDLQGKERMIKASTF
jgi:release factor glutamine methyltransferase